MKKGTKFLGMIIAIMTLACISAQGKVFAAPSTKVIRTSGELSDAIQNQADGETWEIQAGTYVLTQTDLDKYSSWGTDHSGADVNAQKAGQGNWYFPIYKNNITINGVGNVVITSDVDTPNGNWASQDFISIWGDNVTINGINIKCKKEQNKAIEVMGKDVTLKNINLEKVDENGSGSIIFNSQKDDGDIGNATIENVTLYSWISATYSKKGNLISKNVTIDFTDNFYAGYSDEQNGYAWRPLINVNGGVTLNNSNLKLFVDDKINLTEQVFIDKLPENTTVVLTEDVAVDKMLNIKRNNITFDLNKHKLTASDAFTNTWANNNDAHLLQVLNAQNVTVKNGSIVTTNKNKHGINVYDSSNVVLENLAVDNTETLGGAPIIVSNSDVTVKGSLDLTIGDNSWYGINVDPKAGSASLKFAAGSDVNMKGGTGDQLVIALDGNHSKINVIGAQAAGLAMDEDGNFVIDDTLESAPVSSNQSKISNPNTGDNLMIYILLLGLSIVSIGGIIIKLKKNA